MATQKGRNWSSGDIVTAANLSSIERGVSAVAEEYTPTTWANGNTVTAAGLNNIEQGIVNAGGSSDFSTATVVCNDMSAVRGCFTSSLPIVEESMTDASYYHGEYGNQLILYKGCAVIDVTEEVVSTSGLIEEITTGTYMVTGDCTITIPDGEVL